MAIVKVGQFAVITFKTFIMKRLINIFISILAIGIFFSCEKESFTNAEPLDNLQTIINPITVLDDIQTIRNPYSIQQYITNPNDADDEKINLQLLEIATTARELFKDNSFNSIILKGANISAINCIDLNKLVATNMLKSTSKISSDFVSAVENADLKHLSKNPLKSGVVEEYIPAIYVPNWETADFEKQPLICPGVEVNSELAGMEDYEDYIVAWYYDEMGNLMEILINEEDAMNTTHPVFIFDNAEEDATKREKSAMVYNTPQPLKSAMTTTEYHSKEFQINHRYEGSGSSEFCITGAQIDESGNAHLICIRNGSFSSWKQISSVSKRNIGRLFSEWKHFCSNDVEPFNSNYIFWNTYERDWSKSAKSLGQATRNGTTIYLNGNRRYSSEWYAYDPSVLNNNPVDLNTIYYSWAKWHNNSKGKYRIWRVDL